MRTYGRITNDDGSKTWVVVQTDSRGFDDDVYLTTLIQTLKGNWNESPFYANYGIPARQSVLQQVFPDFYVALTQQQFAQYFAGLSVAKVQDAEPHYKIGVTTHQGATVAVDVPT